MHKPTMIAHSQARLGSRKPTVNVTTKMTRTAAWGSLLRESTHQANIPPARDNKTQIQINDLLIHVFVARLFLLPLLQDLLRAVDAYGLFLYHLGRELFDLITLGTGGDRHLAGM